MGYPIKAWGGLWGEIEPFCTILQLFFPLRICYFLMGQPKNCENGLLACKNGLSACKRGYKTSFNHWDTPLKHGGPLNTLWERLNHFVPFCSYFSRFKFAGFKTVKMTCWLVKMGCLLVKLVVQCLCM